MAIKNIIKYALPTEKSIRLIEAENKLIFIVDRCAKKEDIKKELEGIFKVKVLKINTQITPDGMKKAYVKFAEDTPAIDIATQLNVL